MGLYIYRALVDDCQNKIVYFDPKRLIDAFVTPKTTKVQEKNGTWEIHYEVSVLYGAVGEKFKLKLTPHNLSNQVIFSGKGDVEVDGNVNCRGNELNIILLIKGKAEKLVSQVIEEIFHRIEEHVREIDVEKEKQKMLEKLVVPEEVKEACIEKVITAGLEVDDELSNFIPIEYRPKITLAKNIISTDTQDPTVLDLTMYKENVGIRIIRESTHVDIVRINDKVGIYYIDYKTNTRLTGKEALDKIKEEICGVKKPVTVMVVGLE